MHILKPLLRDPQGKGLFPFFLKFFCLPSWLIIILVTLLVFPYNGQAVEKKPDDVGISTPSGKENKETAVTEPLPLEEMHITAYTKAFAERFGLEQPAPGTEPTGGLEAMEITVEKPVKWSDFYKCHFYLYLDSSLPIKFPEPGVAGNKWMLIGLTHFFARPHEQWMKWSIQDRRHSTLLDGNYNMKAFLATMDYIPNKKGAIDSIDYVEFHKDLLPGLTYIKLEVTGDLLLDKPRRDVGIFLQRSTETEYRGRIYIEPGDFLKFRIPDHVYAKLREWGLKVRKVNKVKMNERRQKEKEAKAKQQ